MMAFILLVLGCSPCETSYGYLELIVETIQQGAVLESTVYITGDDEAFFTKPDMDSYISVELPAGVYEIEAENLPLSCYSQQPLSVVVTPCEMTSQVLRLDNCK